MFVCLESLALEKSLCFLFAFVLSAVRGTHIFVIEDVDWLERHSTRDIFAFSSIRDGREYRFRGEFRALFSFECAWDERNIATRFFKRSKIQRLDSKVLTFFFFFFFPLRRLYSDWQMIPYYHHHRKWSILTGPSLVRRFSPGRRKLRLEFKRATVLPARNWKSQIVPPTTEISNPSQSFRSALGIAGA